MKIYSCLKLKKGFLLNDNYNFVIEKKKNLKFKLELFLDFISYFIYFFNDLFVNRGKLNRKIKKNSLFSFFSFDFLLFCFFYFKIFFYKKRLIKIERDSEFLFYLINFFRNFFVVYLTDFFQSTKVVDIFFNKDFFFRFFCDGFFSVVYEGYLFLERSEEFWKNLGVFLFERRLFINVFLYKKNFFISNLRKKNLFLDVWVDYKNKLRNNNFFNVDYFVHFFFFSCFSSLKYCFYSRLFYILILIGNYINTFLKKISRGLNEKKNLNSLFFSFKKNKNIYLNNFFLFGLLKKNKKQSFNLLNNSFFYNNFFLFSNTIRLLFIYKRLKNSLFILSILKKNYFFANGLYGNKDVFDNDLFLIDFNLFSNFLNIKKNIFNLYYINLFFYLRNNYTFIKKNNFFFFFNNKLKIFFFNFCWKYKKYINNIKYLLYNENLYFKSDNLSIMNKFLLSNENINNIIYLLNKDNIISGFKFKFLKQLFFNFFREGDFELLLDKNKINHRFFKGFSVLYKKGKVFNCKEKKYNIFFSERSSYILNKLSFNSNIYKSSFYSYNTIGEINNYIGKKNMREVGIRGYSFFYKSIFCNLFINMFQKKGNKLKIEKLLFNVLYKLRTFIILGNPLLFLYKICSIFVRVLYYKKSSSKFGGGKVVFSDSFGFLKQIKNLLRNLSYLVDKNKCSKSIFFSNSVLLNLTKNLSWCDRLLLTIMHFFFNSSGVFTKISQEMEQIFFKKRVYKGFYKNKNFYNMRNDASINDLVYDVEFLSDIIVKDKKGVLINFTCNKDTVKKKSIYINK